MWSWTKSNRLLVGACLVVAALLVSEALHERVENASENYQGASCNEYGSGRSTATMPPTQNLDISTEEHAHCCCNEPGGTWWEKFLGDPVATFTGVLALLTFMLVAVGAWQGTILERSTKVAEEAARDAKVSALAVVSQLRAYVGITETIVTNIGGEGPITIFVTVKNTGQTPAYDVVVWQAASLRTFPLDSLLESPPPEMLFSALTLSPGGESRSISAHPQLSRDDLTSMIESTKAFYVWGEIRYRDAFSNRRVTRFRKYIRGGPFDPNANVLTTYASEGNDAD